MPVSLKTTERVLEKISVTFLADCWEWKGFKVTRGYGGLTVDRKIYLAHRLVYAILMSWDKDFSSDVKIRHKCDNPSCVNFTHLEHGSHQDNMQDRFKRATPKEFCLRGHKRFKPGACPECAIMHARVRTGTWLWDSTRNSIYPNPDNPPIPKTWVSKGKLHIYP